MSDGDFGPERRERFRLGDHWVTPSANEISGVRIDAKAMAVLMTLVDAAPQVVPHAVMLGRVWPDVVVVDNVVHQAISQLRKALRDDPRVPRYIENVPRRGYRLSPNTRIEMPTRAPLISVAVVPFRLRNVGRDQDFLSIALADATIHALSSIGKLIVRPIASVLPYKDGGTEWSRIARDLDVEIVVQGVVHAQGTKLRVLTEALRARDAQALHSAKHDGDVDDLFGLQDRIADSISSVFRPQSQIVDEPSKPPTKSREAYELYLRAIDRMAHVDKFDMEIAIETLTRVVELEPNFADAWGRLAEALTQMGMHLDTDPRWFERAEDAIAKTLALDPVNSDALCARAMVLWSQARGFQYRPALRAINASLQINPHREIARSIRAAILFHLGFYQQPVRDLEDALLTNPGYVLASTTGGMIATYQGEYEAAHDFYSRALQLNPAHLHANLFSAAPLIYLGRLSEARERVAKARRILPEEPELTAMEGLILAHEGDFKNAERLADAAVASPRSMTHTHHTWHDAAGAYALCDRPDKAVRELRRCAEMGLPNYALFGSDPHLRGLHDHPDFQALLIALRRDRDEFKEQFALEQ